MSNWWEQPLRAITLEFPASNVAQIDVATIIDEAQQSGVNTLCVFSIGYYPGGTAFYQSKIAPHYPGLGERDLLAECLERAHQHGQKVVAYVASIWGGREMYLAHPDWAQRKANGSVDSWDEDFNSVAMCPNSPYRDYLAALVREIGDNYPVDGFYFDEPSFQSWCNCENCQKKFYLEKKAAIPTREEWSNAVFHDFLSWRYRQISCWRQELYKLSKRGERCVFFQGAFPLANLRKNPIQISGLTFDNPYQQRFGVEWLVPLAHGDDMLQTARIGDLVHFELYRRAVGEPLWWYGVALRYGQAISKGKQILALSMMAQTPFDLYGLPDAELKLSIAELAANCASPLFARYYPDRVDEEAWQRVYRELKGLQQIEGYLSNRESVKHAALLYSQSTIEQYDYLEGKPAHLSCLKGFAKILMQEHILFDILVEDDLPTRIKDYQVLILPNAACLSNETKEAVRRYVDGGGGLVASYESGLYDEHGRRSRGDDLARVLGVRYLDEPPTWHGFDVYTRFSPTHSLTSTSGIVKPIPTGGIMVGVEPVGSEVAAELMRGAAVHYGPLGEQGGPPTVLTHRYGKGRVVYLAPSMGNRYLEFGIPDLGRLVWGAVSWAAGQPAAVRLENAPHSMALTAYRQAEASRTVIHLVDSVRDEISQPIIELPEWRNVSVVLETTTSPRSLQLLISRGRPELRREGSRRKIDLPPIKGHEVLVVEE